jgi:predicted ferric reductase
MPDSLLQIVLIVGILSLVHFQYWLNREWWRLDPSKPTLGLWLISAHNVLGLLVSTYAIFDLSLVKVG